MTETYDQAFGKTAREFAGLHRQRREELREASCFLRDLDHPVTRLCRVVFWT